jgi:hypothetical protein
MEGSVEERKPVADERRPGWIVEKRSDRLGRAPAFEQEDDLGLGQEDGVSVEGCLELRGAEGRVLGEKRLCSPTTVGFQTSSKDEALHGGKPTFPARDMSVAGLPYSSNCPWLDPNDLERR